jgi:predicted transcriptional regulator
MRKIRVTMTLRPELVKRVDRLAKQMGESRSRMAASLLFDALDQQEMAIRATGDPVLMNAVARVMTEPGMMRAVFSGLRSELTEDQFQLFSRYTESVAAAVQQQRPGLQPKAPRRARKT